MVKSSKPGKLLFCFLLCYLSLSINVNAYWYEVAVRAKDNYNNPISVNVRVYEYNSAIKNFVQLRSGNTSSARFWGDAPDKYYNGAFDIRQDGMYDANCPLFSALPAADIYYVRIGNKYFKLHYNPNYTEPPYIINYGDMMFEYIGGNVSLASKSTGCAYDVYGPYDWQEKTITLRNDFGGDKTTCFGNIYFNSEILTNVGYIGTSVIREAQTFPHTVTGIDNQVVNGFTRKWRRWNDNYTAIRVVSRFQCK